MSCIFQYYKAEEVYYPMLYCSVTQKPCLYRKKCNLEHKYITADGVDTSKCSIYMKNITNTEIPNGAVKVLMTRVRPNGKYSVYFEVDGVTYKANTDLTEFDQEYIYPIQTENGYDISLTQPKKTTRKKKSTVEEAEETAQNNTEQTTDSVQNDIIETVDE